jgi:dihydrofolate synthase/folylpolyglutamate synthase
VLSRGFAVGGQRLAIRGLLGEYHDLFLPLFGSYQAGNAACALAAVEAFSGATGSGHNGVFRGVAPPGEHDAMAPVPLEGDLVAEAFAMMTSPGRFEIVRRSPLIVIDAAHNPAGMAATAAAVPETFGPAEVIAVLAVSGDKDVVGILGELEPVAAAVVVTRNSSPRSMEAGMLAELAAGVFGPDRVHRAERLDDAIDLAVGLADETAAGIGGPFTGLARGDPGPDSPVSATLVLVTGSVITAGDAKILLGGVGSHGPREAGGGVAGDRA